jgi:hypothetical protein
MLFPRLSPGDRLSEIAEMQARATEAAVEAGKRTGVGWCPR